MNGRMNDFGLAPLASYNRILVIGSCLAHDAAKALFRKTATYSYIWRMSTPSMMSTRAALPVDIEMSDSERLTFERDLYKTPPVWDSVANADAIVFDLVRDSYDFLLLGNGSVVTRGVEMEKYAIEQRIDVAERFHLGTLQHFEAWLSATRLFADMMRTSGKPIIVIRPRWMHLYLRDWRFSLIDNFDQFEIVRRNLIVGHYGRIMEALLGSPVALTIPEPISYADPAHPWGANPLHLHAASIRDIVEPLRKAVESRSGLDRLRGQKDAARDSEGALREMLNDKIIPVPRLS